MAVYRLGDMIRMRREALGLTQDKLVEIYDAKESGEENAEKKKLESALKKKKNEEDNKNNEICSTQVLRRIENGGVGRAKTEVFRKLMMKMGALPGRSYASLLVTECRALNLRSEIRECIRQREYEQAEKKLQRLETMMVPGYPRNEQYLMEKKTILLLKKGETSAEECLKILFNALRCTIPMLDKIDIAEWPLNTNEFDIISDIVNAYQLIEDREKELEFLLKLKKNIERKYTDRGYYVAVHMRALEGLSQWMCMSRQHEKSIEYCKTGLEECRKQRILGHVYSFLYDIAWNRENMIREGIFPKEKTAEMRETFIKKERAFCKKQLVQAYYLSVAQGDLHGSERIKKLYECFYPEEIKLL